MKIRTLFLTLFILTAGLLSAQDYGPGTDIIGYGYNIFGKFADNSSKKPYPIFNFGDDRTMRIGASQYLVPQGVMLENIAEKKKTVVSGSSQREYAKSFGASVGVEVDALTFGASVNTSFSKSWGGSEQQYYYTLRDANRTWRVSIDRRLKYDDLLDSQAKNDIETMNPDDLLDIYGTHVIVNAFLGGRADYTVVTKMTESYSASEIAAAVEGTYSSVSVGVESSFTNSEREVLNNSRESLTVTGGNSEFANNIDNYDAYTKWAEGIRSMPVLCDFEKGSLIPIWDLASTQKRRNEIKGAFDRLAAQYPLPEAFAGLGVGMADNCYFIQSKSSGTYWDFKGAHYDAETFGGRLGLFPHEFNQAGQESADRFIKLVPHKNQKEYVFFQPQHLIGGAVDVVNGSHNPGAPLGIWHFGENNQAQMFKMIEVDGEKDTYYIQNAASGLYFTENNGGITQENKTGGDNQQWKFEKADNALMAPPFSFRSYRIRPVYEGTNMVWDVTGGHGSGAPIQLWEANFSHAQSFYLTPYGYNQVMFRPMHDKTVALDMHKEENSGLGVYSHNFTGSQKFSFEWTGSPLQYRIKLTDFPAYVTVKQNETHSGGTQLIAKPLIADQKRQTWVVEPAAPMPNAAPERAWYSGSWAPGVRVLQSANLIYSLVFQRDGNLVIYADGQFPVWSSGTHGSGAVRFEFKDSFMIIYGPNNREIWKSHNFGPNGETMFLQDDGNLVLHASGAIVVWAAK